MSNHTPRAGAAGSPREKRATLDTAILAVCRLCLSVDGRIVLSREEHDELQDILVGVLEEANDATPKLSKS